MSLIVQDDSGTAVNANSYVSVAEFKAYHVDRATEYDTVLDDDGAISAALIKATDYVDQRFNFIGRRQQGRQQTTEWPRINAWDRGRYYINGVPAEIKEAVCEYALKAAQSTLNPDPTLSTTGAAIQSKTETVGPITESTTYVSGAAFTMPRYPVADQKIIKSGLTISGGDVWRG